MPEINEQPNTATQLQETDFLLVDQNTGSVDSYGRPIYQTKKLAGSALLGGGSAALPPNAILGNPPNAGQASAGQAIALDPQAFAIDAGNTLRLISSVADNLVAQGALQADALQLNNHVNVVTAALAGTGVVAPSLASGEQFEVWNLAANPVAVYPLPGGVIGSGQVNAPVVLFPGNVFRFRVRSGAAGQSKLLVG